MMMGASYGSTYIVALAACYCKSKIAHILRLLCAFLAQGKRFFVLHFTRKGAVWMYQHYNGNPRGKSVGDCTVRAISKALGWPWYRTYWALCDAGAYLADMPSSNAVWGDFLRSNGFSRYAVPDTCPDCYTVADFAAEHPRGTYILALSGHVVCVENGVIYDAWDSSSETVIFYWER